MTSLKRNTTLVRETDAVYRGKALVVELRLFFSSSMLLRPKGARYGYEVDYLAIFQLGARKEAERLRAERERLKAQRATRRGQR